MNKHTFQAPAIVGNKPTEIFFYDGEIISAHTRTTFETRQMPATPSGVGQIKPGEIYNQAVDVTDVWLRLDDGKEMKLKFELPGLGLRGGHRVVLGVRMHGTEEKPVYARNVNTGQEVTYSTNLITGAETGNGWMLWALLLTLAIATGCALWSIWPDDRFRGTEWLLKRLAYKAEEGGSIFILTCVAAIIPIGFLAVLKRSIKLTSAAKKLAPIIKAEGSKLTA